MEVFRLGKYIIFELDEGYLISHLRMTGQWFFAEEDNPPLNYERWVIPLGGGSKLVFTDVRRFGTLSFVGNLIDYGQLSLLGPDGLELNAPEAVTSVGTKLSKSRKPIKNALLDQSIIAGIGNIYAAQILWELGIHPSTIAKDVAYRASEICSTTYSIFCQAIELGGCSISDYKGGKYHEKLTVYGKEGKPCPKCSTQVSKMIQSGRSTFYCSSCQKLGAE